MIPNTDIDGVLIQWGERLFYPGNRIVKAHTPRLRSMEDRAAAIRGRIEATVRRAPQVMVKVTGGGRGMGAIAAHFRYISKNGRLDIEDDRGVVERGKDTLRELERAMALRRLPTSHRKVIVARPSTSCCRCRAAPTR